MAEYKLFTKRRGLSAHAGNKETKLPPTIHVWSEEESEDDEDVITPKVQGKDWNFLTIYLDWSWVQVSMTSKFQVNLF